MNERRDRHAVVGRRHRRMQLEGATAAAAAAAAARHHLELAQRLVARARHAAQPRSNSPPWRPAEQRATST